MSAGGYEHFDDTAFHAQSSFDFDDFRDDRVHHLSSSDADPARLGKRDLGTMLDSSTYGSLSSYPLFAGSNDSNDMAPAAWLDTSEPARTSMGPPRPVAKGVVQRLGQIRDPEDSRLGLRVADGTGEDGRDQSVRARNAANQRHSKKLRKDSMDAEGDHSGDDDDDGGEGGGKKERYREKNRQAAAKCRDKKKKNTEQLDKKYRVIAADNAAIKQEVRMLRDEFCRIRELALQHGPEQCSCSSLHAFNMQQAVKEASSMARMMGDMPMMHSPGHERSSSISTSMDSAGDFAAAPAFPDPTLGYDFAPEEMDFQR